MPARNDRDPEHADQKGNRTGPAMPLNRKVTAEPETTPAEERGERIDTGKTIARGGKTTGHVEGATEQQP
jgi:hypothetical protein